MKTFEELTTLQKQNIGEFVFSKSLGVLIKSDGFNLIDTFFELGFVDQIQKEELTVSVDWNFPGIVEMLTNILEKNITSNEGAKIMRWYFEGC